MSRQYDIAISFAGEDRDVAHAIASKLTSEGVSVFYDEFEKADLWGKDLYEHLISVYKDKSKYCLMLLSENYSKKLWTTHERKAAQARAFRESKEYILPLRLDDAEVTGILETTGYLDYRNETADSVAEQILIKIWGNLKNDLGLTILKEKLEDLYRRMMIACDLAFMPSNHINIKQHGLAMEMHTSAVVRLTRIREDLKINSSLVDRLVLSQLTEVLDNVEKILKRASFLMFLEDPSKKNLDFISEIPKNEFENVYEFLKKISLFDGHAIKINKHYTPDQIIKNWEEAEAETDRYHSNPKIFKRTSGRTPFVFNATTLINLDNINPQDGDSVRFYDDSY